MEKNNRNRRSSRFDRAYIEITNVCNLNCSFCPGHDRQKRFMSLSRFAYYAGILRAYTDCFYLHVMGEPLLHPELDAILSVCDDLAARAVITTNGTLLGEKGGILLSHPCIYKIQISLHSFEANAGTDGDYFDRCFDFAGNSSSRGIITVLRLWNADGRSAGRSALNQGILSTLRDRFSGFWSENKRGYCISPKLYLEYDERFVWPDARGQILSQTGFCRALHDQIAVLCDGTVVPCCLDANGALALGNLNNEALESILEKDAVREMTAGFEKRILTRRFCQTCGYADRFRRKKITEVNKDDQ